MKSPSCERGKPHIRPVVDTCVSNQVADVAVGQVLAENPGTATAHDVRSARFAARLEARVEAALGYDSFDCPVRAAARDLICYSLRKETA